MHDAPAERRRVGVRLVHVERVVIAGEPGECLYVSSADEVRDLGLVAHLKLVEAILAHSIS